MTATPGAPVLFSAGVNVRPSAGWTPSTSKKLADTRAPGSCSGRSPSVALNRSFATAARPLSIVSRAASSTNAGYEKGPSTMARFGFDPERRKRRPESLNGSGRSSAVSTILKTAVLAPMPIATIATATRVNSRAFRSDRTAYRASDHITLPGGGAERREAAMGERREIEVWIAAGDHVREDAAGGGRMLKPVAAEPVDQEEALYALGGADDRVAIRRHLVKPGPRVRDRRVRQRRQTGHGHIDHLRQEVPLHRGVEGR